MKKYINLILLCNLISTTTHAEELWEKENIDIPSINFSFLSKSLATDHVYVFNELFKLIPNCDILEFGCGYGSKYLLENCNHLTSYEITVKDRFNYIMPWFIKVNAQLKPKFSNWQLEMYVLNEKVNRANNIALEGKDPRLSDNQYLAEIRKFFNKICTDKLFDIIFIDPGIHIRADFVNEAFNRSDIIVVHDTNFNNLVYGWNRIKVPSNYTKIHFNYGSGTSIWIKNDRQPLINVFKKNLQDKEYELKFSHASPASSSKAQNASIEEHQIDAEKLQTSLWEQLSNTNNTGNQCCS